MKRQWFIKACFSLGMLPDFSIGLPVQRQQVYNKSAATLSPLPPVALDTRHGLETTAIRVKLQA
jgi:hypothetical protein